MPDQLLFVVDDAFDISGRGCVLAPGILATSPRVHVGDAIRLVRPDGSECLTRLQGVEMLNYGRRPRPAESMPIPISLEKPIAKRDVPPGTQVFLVATAPPDEPRDGR
jgi:hypothetical protein